MRILGTIGNIVRGINRFFPINLVFTHIKYNVIMLFYWAFLFAIINNFVGMGLGIPYLFLSPEYLGTSDWVAYFLLGIGIGGFITAFHIYSYIQVGSKYPFIATLSNPFYKFSLNNSIIPIVFLINLSVNIFIFQRQQEYNEIVSILLQVLAMNVGVGFFLMIALIYFLPTNKNIFKISGKKKHEFLRESSNIHASLHRHQTWYKSFLSKETGTYFYLSSFIKIKRSRSTVHYDSNMLHKVFTQNHINASVFEVLLLISFVVIGLFSSYEIFQFPAGVSIMMLLTLVIMLVSALFSWFRAWSFPIIIGIFIFINYLSLNSTFFQFKSFAYGLPYLEESLLPYNKATLENSRSSDSVVREDYFNYIKTLENWKQKTGQEKPKLVIINTSGGGLRSATWTFRILQELDSLTEKSFSNSIQMMTGASGGMVGAAYYRDLIKMENEGAISSRLKEEYRENISKDLLNRLSFSIPTKDLFFRLKKVEVNGYEYRIDRGYDFEEELISNLDGAFNRTLGDYTAAEQSAEIPTMIFTPTIINDGRRLLIGAQHHGYLQGIERLDREVGIEPGLENIEYLKFFASIQPEKINFTSVLRMNATFPYIMPMVSLPTTPEIYVMDAGIRDNYGTKITIPFLITFRDWIEKNTSGVIIVRIRDNKKGLADDQPQEFGLFKRMILPFGNMYGNFPRVQDFNQDELLSATLRSVEYPINVVTFNLREKYEEKIALSWHLTSREKEKIMKAVYSDANKKAIKELLLLLNFNLEE